MKKISQEGKVSFPEAVKDFCKGYFDFGGRSTRAGFWWPQLAIAIIYVVLFIIVSVQASNSSYYYGPSVSPVLVLFIFLFSLALIVPLLALTVRRMRDTGLKGKTILAIYVIYFALYGTFMMSMYSSLINMLSNIASAYSSYLDSSSATTYMNFNSSPLVTFFMFAFGLFISICMFLPTNGLATKSNHPILTSIFYKKP